MAANKLTMKISTRPWLKHVCLALLLVRLPVPMWIVRLGTVINRGGTP